jgi:hypothetical protein
MRGKGPPAKYVVLWIIVEGTNLFQDDQSGFLGGTGATGGTKTYDATMLEEVADF